MGLKAPQKYYLTLRGLNSCPDPSRVHDTFEIDRTGLAPLTGRGALFGAGPGVETPG